MKFRKLNTGNYFGYYRGYYFFFNKKCGYDLVWRNSRWENRVRFWFGAYVGKAGKWIYSQGVFGSSLTTLKKAKDWAKKKIDSISTEKK